MNSIKKIYILITFISFFFQIQSIEIIEWDEINLPDKHLPFYFKANPKIKKKCENDDLCPFKQVLNSTSCYGYEKLCKVNDTLIVADCSGNPRVPWVSFIL